ncbi:MAG: Ldh family oxidoreductase [Candidatus Rokuibacteriota bacterium]
MVQFPECVVERRVPVEALRATVSTIFERCGMSPEDAGMLAETLVGADLRGVHSHGVMRVPDYVHKLRRGGVDPRGRPRVVRESAGTLVVDGGNSMGQIGAHFAMRRAIERARTTNVSAAAVRGSNHCGAMAYFAMLALPEDMIGVATTNALPTMAPWGGVDRILGINPLAVAIPAAEERPVVFDGAFSHSARGKIQVYEQKGRPIPEGWAFDAEGRPTTDPRAALDGLLQPIGGYKGIGLALVFGVLATVLSGASYGTELGDLGAGPKPGEDGHFFLALRVGAFEEPARFKRRVDGIVREIRQGRRAPGVERLYLPGELEAEAERRYRREGIPLNEVTVAGIASVAAELGVSADFRP